MTFEEWYKNNIDIHHEETIVLVGKKNFSPKELAKLAWEAAQSNTKPDNLGDGVFTGSWDFPL